jgi:DMSO/TMAO reductase YedYZ molybdopterin-dependent catalytic subunit
VVRTREYDAGGPLAGERAAAARSWRHGALCGLTAAAAALGTAELVSVFTGPQSSPLVAVGGVVVDSVPASVKDFATSVFYTYDKLALIIGTLVILALFAIGFGILAVRNVAYGVVGVGVFGLVGLAAAVTRPNAGPSAAFPSLLGAAAGALVLVWLLRIDPTGDDAGPSDARQGGAPARRKFLQAVGGVLAGAAVIGFGGRWFADRRNVSADRAAIDLPSPVDAATPLPPEVDLKLPQLTPFLTANDNFYRIDTALVVPQVSPDGWTLKIHGRVKNPITLTYAELAKRPMIERYVTLACVSNEVGGNLISTARFLGVPLKALLEEAGPLAGADQVVSRSVDGFTAGTPTAVLLDGRDAMLAVGMNGEPLPIEHGFPVRIVVPGLYGYVSATKWLAEIELSSFADFDAYWIRRGWAQQAPIKTESRIDTPGDGSSVSAGSVTVAGVAWAQHRGISKVEVQVDDGPWETARLAAVPSIDTWRQWAYSWTAPAGKHRLTVRATDNAGQTQTDAVSPPDPDGATGWHSVQVTVK